MYLYYCNISTNLCINISRCKEIKYIRTNQSIRGATIGVETFFPNNISDLEKSFKDLV